MRLFVAVVPPPAVLDDLAAAIDRMRPTVDPALRLRWTERPQWHLTLSFLGEVDAGVLPDLRRRLARAARRHEPMRLVIQGGGGFSSARRARVLWAGIQGDVVRLSRLAGSVTAAAQRCGLDVASGRFRPHLTLARLREPADLRTQVAWWASYTGPAWEVTQFELVRSYLPEAGQARPRYESLDSWSLGRDAQRAEKRVSPG
ncbi:MAG TPA: RNA 2',3'-cyclic phosphodiesterase [Actinopolymorphaceae bacterium]